MLTENEMLMMALDAISDQIQNNHAAEMIALAAITHAVKEQNNLFLKIMEGAAIQVSTEAVEEPPQPNRYGR